MSARLSKTRLARLRAGLSGAVERGEVAGLVALTARGGDVHVETMGVQDLSTGTAMRRDTIFRVASMTKPVTAVAAMILVEEAEIRLDDPIDRWLPELSDRRVLSTPGERAGRHHPGESGHHGARPSDLPHGVWRGDGAAGPISDPGGDG
jgi:CubicO group peptidase (beta-lactamase class C family)